MDLNLRRVETGRKSSPYIPALKDGALRRHRVIIPHLERPEAHCFIGYSIAHRTGSHPDRLSNSVTESRIV